MFYYSSHIWINNQIKYETLLEDQSIFDASIMKNRNEVGVALSPPMFSNKKYEQHLHSILFRILITAL